MGCSGQGEMIGNEMSGQLASSTVNILLVEDDPDDVVFVRRAFASVWSECKLHVVTNGEMALEYLHREGEFSDAPTPDLVLLDLNMPFLNGWQFLDLYRELDDDLKSQLVIIMLTTSLNPDDREKAINIKEINGFRNKPLTKEVLLEVVDQYFSKFFTNGVREFT